jgi:hypothetical protein
VAELEFHRKCRHRSRRRDWKSKSPIAKLGTPVLLLKVLLFLWLFKPNFNFKASLIHTPKKDNNRSSSILSSAFVVSL